MTTETKFKDYEQIMNEVETRAKSGSCKICQFCLRLGTEAFRSDYPLKINEIPTCICVMQDINGFWLKDSDLEKEAYPIICDIGRWCEQDDYGNTTELGCRAFKPLTTTDKNTIIKAANQQRDFLRTLSRASRYHNWIECVEKGKAQSWLAQSVKKLNEIGV